MPQNPYHMAYMAAMMATTAASNNQYYSTPVLNDPPAPKKPQWLVEEERNKARGLTHFEFPGGFECWAVNRKVAERKYQKHLKNL